ncbi:hypothetical protein D0437_27640 [Bacillus cereus]|uniref:Uncharacterized protein n=1 Tax=Bacillus cereus TaxID=1396 RepID=A0A9X7QN55_BACCE|nr:hypothetical protein D0437_27640 [Bacillus cereus]
MKRRIRANFLLLIALSTMLYVFQTVDPYVERINIFAWLPMMGWFPFSLLYISVLVAVISIWILVWKIMMWVVRQWMRANEPEDGQNRNQGK